VYDLPQPWLIDVHRRTLKDVKLPQIRVDQYPSYVYDIIMQSTWPYKTTPEYYHARDRAMMSLTFLSCGRINETLRVTKQQVDLEGDADFVVVRNFYVSKRKESTLKRYGLTIIDVPMPKNETALLYPFTKLVLDYLPNIENAEDRSFNIGTNRAFQIIRYCTGLWCHWFRSLGLSFYVNTLKNPIAVAKIFGVQNVNTIMHYFKGTWLDYRDQLSK